MCDTGNSRIRKISPQGQVSTFAGSVRGFADGLLLEAQFGAPSAIMLTTRGFIFVCDSDPPVLRRITPEGVVTTVAGRHYGNLNGPGNRARFALPTALATSETGELLLADGLNHALKLITLDA